MKRKKNYSIPIIILSIKRLENANIVGAERRESLLRYILYSGGRYI